MRVEDLVKYHGVRLVPSARDHAELGFLPAMLEESGYTTQGLRDLLGVIDVPNVEFHELPGYLWRCDREDSPRATLARLWLFCQKLETARVEALLGSERVQTLIRRRLLRTLPDGLLEACVDLYPCEGACVFTDRMFGLTRFSSHVYELGKDSYALARATPRDPVESTLDLCSGSGIHAILAARHSQRCLGVDLNERALTFARVNAGLNGVADRCSFLHGDLYGPVEGQTFDLIVSNPPWVPTPDTDMEIYRTGGETGESITQRTVEGLGRHLREGGTLSMFVIYPILRGQAYVDRVRGWLGGSHGWGITHTLYSESTVESFIRMHAKTTPDWVGYDQEFRRWMDCYERLGIEKVGLGTLYVRRLRADHPGWAEERRVLFPLRATGALVSRRLERLSRYHDPTPFADGHVPEVDPEVARLWSAADGAGLAEFHNGGWAPPAALEPEEARVASLVDGRRTVADLAGSSGLAPEATSARIQAVLRSLGQKGVLRWWKR